MCKEKTDYLPPKTTSQKFFDDLGWVITWGLKISGVIIIAIVSWRLIANPFEIDLTEFSFNDLLSLLLALFAMFISILFYFKSTESSDNFYRKTFDFTKDMSEKIGRIEATFSERLSHLDSILSKLEDRVYANSKKVGLPEKELEKQNEETSKEIERVNKEQERLIQELNIGSKEKDELKRQLSEIQKERDLLQAQSIHSISTISKMQDIARKALLGESGERAIQFLSRNKELCKFILNKDYNEIKKFFSENKSDFPQKFLSDLIDAKIIDTSLEMNQEGYKILKGELLHLLESQSSKIRHKNGLIF